MNNTTINYHHQHQYQHHHQQQQQLQQLSQYQQHQCQQHQPQFTPSNICNLDDSINLPHKPNFDNHKLIKFSYFNNKENTKNIQREIEVSSYGHSNTSRNIRYQSNGSEQVKKSHNGSSSGALTERYGISNSHIPIPRYSKDQTMNDFHKQGQNYNSPSPLRQYDLNRDSITNMKRNPQSRDNIISMSYSKSLTPDQYESRQNHLNHKQNNNPLYTMMNYDIDEDNDQYPIGLSPNIANDPIILEILNKAQNKLKTPLKDDKTNCYDEKTNDNCLEITNNTSLSPVKFNIKHYGTNSQQFSSLTPIKSNNHYSIQLQKSIIQDETTGKSIPNKSPEIRLSKNSNLNQFNNNIPTNQNDYKKRMSIDPSSYATISTNSTHKTNPENITKNKYIMKDYSDTKPTVYKHSGSYSNDNDNNPDQYSLSNRESLTQRSQGNSINDYNNTINDDNKNITITRKQYNSIANIQNNNGVKTIPKRFYQIPINLLNPEKTHENSNNGESSLSNNIPKKEFNTTGAINRTKNKQTLIFGIPFDQDELNMAIGVNYHQENNRAQSSKRSNSPDDSTKSQQPQEYFGDTFSNLDIPGSEKDDIITDGKDSLNIDMMSKEPKKSNISIESSERQTDKQTTMNTYSTNEDCRPSNDSNSARNESVYSSVALNDLMKNKDYIKPQEESHKEARTLREKNTKYKDRKFDGQNLQNSNYSVSTTSSMRLDNGDGLIYEGELKSGKRDGYGIIRTNNGTKIFEGNWRIDKYHGKGKEYNLHNDIYAVKTCENFPFAKNKNTWIRYEGDFKDGNWDGVGKLFFHNGEEFYGQFKENQIDGKGSYYTVHGEIVIGIWQNGQIVQKV